MGETADRVETVPFDLSAFSIESLKKAAYRFIDRFAFDVNTDGKKAVCRLIFPPKTSDATVQRVVSDFRKEVLDQDLRQLIAAETAPIRNTTPPSPPVSLPVLKQHGGQD